MDALHLADSERNISKIECALVNLRASYPDLKAELADKDGPI